MNGADTIRVDDIAVYSDTELQPSVSFSVAEDQVIEGDVLDVEVRLDLASTEPVSVALGAVDGSATVGDDVVDPSATVEFAPGQTSRTVQVATVADDAEEASETFALENAREIRALRGSWEAIRERATTLGWSLDEPFAGDTTLFMSDPLRGVNEEN